LGIDVFKLFGVRADIFKLRVGPVLESKKVTQLTSAANRSWYSKASAIVHVFCMWWWCNLPTIILHDV